MLQSQFNLNTIWNSQSYTLRFTKESLDLHLPQIAFRSNLMPIGASFPEVIHAVCWLPVHCNGFAIALKRFQFWRVTLVRSDTWFWLVAVFQNIKNNSSQSAASFNSDQSNPSKPEQGNIYWYWQYILILSISTILILVLILSFSLE